jgi:hypothetical protein
MLTVSVPRSVLSVVFGVDGVDAEQEKRRKDIRVTTPNYNKTDQDNGMEKARNLNFCCRRNLRPVATTGQYIPRGGQVQLQRRLHVCSHPASSSWMPNYSEPWP